jgi:hypothetical protein
LDSRQTTSDEPSASVQGPHSELLALVRSVRGHLEDLEASGAWGLPAAHVDVTIARGSGARAEARGAALASVPTREPAALREPGALAAPPALESPAPPPPSGDAGAARLVHLPQASMDRLLQLATEASVCTRCALHEGRGRSVFARGGGSSGIVFVGEGPGEEEDRQGLPFVGPAGLRLQHRQMSAPEEPQAGGRRDGALHAVPR